MKPSTTLITAAGGNGTAIRVIDEPLSRSEYEKSGKILESNMQQYGAEQAGFLVLQDRHFEMAGGEFCGNATRAAALLLARITGSSELSFTTSGFDGSVSAVVASQSSNICTVSCRFPGMPTVQQDVVLAGGQKAVIVNLGGIVHVVIDNDFPKNPSDYTAAHQAINRQFRLDLFDAVGVIWYQWTGNSVTMHPVVWVKAVDTFYYETSCGSGAIAVAKVTGMSIVTQPTGKVIAVDFLPDAVVLGGEMQVIET